MPCPHQQFATERNLFAASEPLSAYLRTAQHCPNCRDILRAIQEVKPGWVDDENNHNAVIEVVHRVGRSFNVPATIRIHQNDQTILAFQVFRRSRAEPMYEEFPKSPERSINYQTLEVSKHSRSDVSYGRASGWLSYCLDHDDICNTPNPNFYPHRLIDVGSSGNSREPFLIDAVSSGQYASLSYCWGPDSGDVLKTTTSNLEDHHQAIPLSLLPASIQDAIDVCRGLKIQYLWVDSLCIVQDDKADWLCESAHMRDIYLNSLLTIAAEEPASCKSGFLGEQKFGTSQWQRHFVTNEEGEDLFVRPHDPEAYLRHSKTSLDKRGWCLQESILPSRRLCFNGDEMVWECLGRKICECGHTFWAPPLSSQAAPRKLPFRQPHQDWRALVEEYSDRSLTHTTDKLSAISGLAKMMAQALKDADTYKAGLWMREFVSDLTWRVLPLGSGRNNSSWRAPSWSWASIDGPVRYGFDKVLSTWKYKPRQVMTCKVDEIVCNSLVLSDPTGPITAAFATLTGPVVPVELVTLDDALSLTWDERCANSSTTDSPRNPISLVRATNLYSFQVFLDDHRGVSLRTQDPWSDCWMEGRCLCSRCLDQIKSEHEAEPQIYCMKLFTWTASGGMNDSGESRTIPPETWFLLLRKVSGGEEALERIGIGVWGSRFDRRSRVEEEECPLFIGCDVSTEKVI